MEVFRRFLNEPLPPLANKYIANNFSENISNSSSTSSKPLPDKLYNSETIHE